MISLIMPLAVGNALTIRLAPPSGASEWRVLRKSSDSFIGHDDLEALTVFEGDYKSFIDDKFLQNGVPQFYKAYYRIGSNWVASETRTGTANASYDDASTDALEVVRDRLTWGLQEEVKRGVLYPSKLGSIPVLIAPPVFEDARWPMVSIHLTSEQPSTRGIGEMIDSDFIDDDLWSEGEGWLASVQLAIIGWTQNPDERIELRKALRRIIVANLPVFDDHGMVQIEFSQQDVDAVSGEYPANIYQAACQLSCLAPVVVRGKQRMITDVVFTSN